jgi:hypothetical protein
MLRYSGRIGRYDERSLDLKQESRIQKLGHDDRGSGRRSLDVPTEDRCLDLGVGGITLRSDR